MTHLETWHPGRVNPSNRYNEAKPQGTHRQREVPVVEVGGGVRACVEGAGAVRLVKR